MTTALDADGFKRITAEELLLMHRRSEIGRGDIVRAVATLTERVAELERTLEDMREANGLFTGR